MKKQLFLTGAVIALMTTFSFSQNLITQVKPAGSKFWGYANLKGELIIPAQYEKCYRFSEDGYATVYGESERKYYFINPKGDKLNTETVSFKDFETDGFSDGLVGIKIGEKWGYMNTDGKLAIPAKYDHVTSFNSGFAVVKLGSTFIVLNRKGEEAMIQESGVLDVKSFSEKMAPFKSKDKRLGFIDSNGKVSIPAQFESVGYFSNGLAWAKTQTGTLGYINPKGEWVIQPQFEAGKNFDASTGLARIKTTTGNWAYVNKTGEISHVNDTDAWGDFSDGLAEGKKGDKRGF